MPSVIRANNSLGAGGIALLKQGLTAADTGQATYSAEYCCLQRFATTWMPRFRSGSLPVQQLPAEITELPLTRTPTLIDVKTTIEHGLFYITATYSAGIVTDVTTTTSTEVRNLSWVSSYSNGRAITTSFDYISTSVRVTGTNSEIPIIKGGVGAPFNIRNGGSNNTNIRQATATTIESQSRSRNQRGEYENSVTSMGIYQAYDVEAPVNTSTSGGSAFPTPVAQVQTSRPVIGTTSSPASTPSTATFPTKTNTAEYALIARARASGYHLTTDDLR